LTQRLQDQRSIRRRRRATRRTHTSGSRLPNEVHRRLRREAKSLGLSTNEYLNLLLSLAETMRAGLLRGGTVDGKLLLLLVDNPLFRSLLQLACQSAMNAVEGNSGTSDPSEEAETETGSDGREGSSTPSGGVSPKGVPQPGGSWPPDGMVPGGGWPTRGNLPPTGQGPNSHPPGWGPPSAPRLSRPATRGLPMVPSPQSPSPFPFG
jgi:hypothetical protein